MTQHSYSKDSFEMGLKESTFEAIKKDYFKEMFKEVLHQDSMNQIRVQFIRMYTALKTSYESEKRLVRKCLELKTIISIYKARLQDNTIKAQKDSQKIASLQIVSEQAWLQVKEARNSEEECRKIISELKSKISNLNSILDHVSRRKQNDVALLIESKAQLEKELELKNNEIAQLQTQISQHEFINKMQYDMIMDKKVQEDQQHESINQNGVEKKLVNQKDNENVEIKDHRFDEFKVYIKQELDDVNDDSLDLFEELEDSIE